MEKRRDAALAMGCLAVIVDACGTIEYDEIAGDGPSIVLVPGSCSTGAAWRPVIAAWRGQFRCVTTSLLGYGRTQERRPSGDSSIAYEAGALETVIRRAGGRVHLVGHSFGGLVALAVALRGKVELASLVVLEAPAAEILRDREKHEYYRAFHEMTNSYFSAFNRGDPEAISAMIDFYGGAGTFASWPSKVRAYAVETTAVNILDWASAYEYPLRAAELATVNIPVLVIYGGASHPAIQKANGLLCACIQKAALATIEDAAHFMISTHPNRVAELIVQHIHSLSHWREPGL